jgi:coproporphyrinogen III oxidase-like Fe-S oxidoreductase
MPQHINGVEYSLNQIKNKWLEKEWKKEDTFNVYVHNPFCPSICSFCIVSGSKMTENSEAYVNYYNEYLPNLIKSFDDVLRSREIDTIYFGGGTASMMTEEIMEQIFELIPNFKNIPIKVFECHPITTTKKKIDILSKYNFSYITFGLQTLNEEILREQNRIPAKLNALKDVIHHAQSNGIYTNCDLLPYISQGNEDGLNQFKRDLTYLIDEIQPNLVTVYPKRQFLELNKDSTNKLEEENKVYDLVYSLRTFLIEFDKSNKNYQCHGPLNLSYESIFKGRFNNYFITNLSREEYDRIKKYNSSGFGNHKKTQNVLGFGSYAHSMAYSYQNDNFHYYQINDNWNVKFMVNHDR